MIQYSTLLISAIAILFALALMDSLVLPLAALVLGFLILGYAFPELLEDVTPYSKTVWLPLGFVVASVIAVYIVFSGGAFGVLMGAKWCPLAPCIPINLVIASFVIGSLAKFGSMKLAHQKLDLFGENIKD